MVIACCLGMLHFLTSTQSGLEIDENSCPPIQRENTYLRQIYQKCLRINLNASINSKCYLEDIHAIRILRWINNDIWCGWLKFQNTWLCMLAHGKIQHGLGNRYESSPNLRITNYLCTVLGIYVVDILMSKSK